MKSSIEALMSARHSAEPNAVGAAQCSMSERARDQPKLVE